MKSKRTRKKGSSKQVPKPSRLPGRGDEDFGRSARRRFPDEKGLSLGEEQRPAEVEGAFVSPSGKAEARRDKGGLKDRGETRPGKGSS